MTKYNANQTVKFTFSFYDKDDDTVLVAQDEIRFRVVYYNTNTVVYETETLTSDATGVYYIYYNMPPVSISEEKKYEYFCNGLKGTFVTVHTDTFYVK